MADLPNGREIKGRKSNGNVFEEAARKKRSESAGRYEHANVTVANPSTDVSLTSLASTFWTRSLDGVANYVEIYTDVAITVAFRTLQNTDVSAANLGHVNLRANTLRVFNYISDITEIYFTNSTGSAAVQVTAV